MLRTAEWCRYTPYVICVIAKSLGRIATTPDENR